MVNLDFIQDNSLKEKLKQTIEKIEIADKSNRSIDTDFLDPYERSIIRPIIGHNLEYYEDGGYDEAERKIIQIYPHYIERTEKLSIIKIISKNKISHREILGSVLGLGLVREKIGDIVSNGDFEHYLIVKNELANYIHSNLEKVGNYKINISFSDKVVCSEKKYISREFVVKSKRLDLFISKAFAIRRDLAKSYIENGFCKVNFAPIKSASSLINEGDLVSLRGYGRVFYAEDLGMSKKDNYFIRAKFPV